MFRSPSTWANLPLFTNLAVRTVGIDPSDFQCMFSPRKGMFIHQDGILTNLDLATSNRIKLNQNRWLVVFPVYLPSEKWWGSSLGMIIYSQRMESHKSHKNPWFQSPPTRNNQNPIGIPMCWCLHDIFGYPTGSGNHRPGAARPAIAVSLPS